MSWAKLSDDYADDCWTLPDPAFRLHTEALVWNGRKLLDCRLPKDDVRRFAKHPEAVDDLLAVGWWREDGDHYVIVHHAQYQRLRVDVLAQQAANAANGAKGGRPRKPSREQASEIKPKPSSPITHPLSESPSGSETEMDRPGQGSITEEEPNGSRAHVREDRRCQRCGERPRDLGVDLCSECVSPRCVHGMPNGEQPDPWLPRDRLCCPECAMAVVS